jgi:uncharacterized membrane-anchored protein YitT (DUF2179 family)
MNRKKVTAFLYQSILLVAGSFLCTVAVKALILPHELLSQGLTGYAIIAYYKWPVASLGVIYFLINIPVFALGWRFVGKRFILYTLWGMAIYSTALSLINFEVSVSDPMLATVIAGALSGLGTALTLRSYGSCGGSDILCVVMNKVFSLTLGTGTIIINVVLLTMAAMIFPMEKVLYTLVFIIVSSQVTNKVFRGMAQRRTAIIISEHWKAIAERLSSCHIGVTVLNGQGGFNGTERMLLYSVIPARLASTLKHSIIEIDTAAFIVIMEADDVTGVEVGNQPHW